MPRKTGTQDAAIIARLQARIERLEVYLEADCGCPCCGEKQVCHEECTFADDDPTAKEKMEFVREVMYGA